VCEA
ncbi:hypothetical protein EC960107_2888, partial [Escherichia coli 96.0107]